MKRGVIIAIALCLLLGSGLVFFHPSPTHHYAHPFKIEIITFAFSKDDLDKGLNRVADTLGEHNVLTKEVHEERDGDRTYFWGKETVEIEGIDPNHIPTPPPDLPQLTPAPQLPERVVL